MIQQDVHRIRDLEAALNRCRHELAETENVNAREIYGRVIVRYETTIAALSRVSVTTAETAKAAY